MASKLNFNDPQALPDLFVSWAMTDSVAEGMVSMVKDLQAEDIPLISKQEILEAAQANLSKVRKESAAFQTAYQYSSRAKTIFGAYVQGFTATEGRSCAGIYADAQKFLKSLAVNWKGEPVVVKAEPTPEEEVATVAMSAPLGDVEKTLETVEKHAAYLLETKGEQYALDLIAVLTGLIDNPVKQAA